MGYLCNRFFLFSQISIVVLFFYKLLTAGDTPITYKAVFLGILISILIGLLFGLIWKMIQYRIMKEKFEEVFKFDEFAEE